MRQALRLHPDSRRSAVEGIVVDAARDVSGVLRLSYLVKGDTIGLAVPPASATARADELWRHTCFEAFVRPLPGEAYFEFNFAPSRKWATYRFDAYRAGMDLAHDIAPSRIEVQTTSHSLKMEVAVEMGGPTGLPSDAVWAVSLTAVIEETSGAKSYWALRHPPGRPDFHHADGLILELPPPEHS